MIGWTSLFWPEDEKEKQQYVKFKFHKKPHTKFLPKIQIILILPPNCKCEEVKKIMQKRMIQKSEKIPANEKSEEKTASEKK